MFYVYTPIYAVESGLGLETGGLIVSAGASALYTVMLWGWLGRKIGIRYLLVLGYSLTGIVTLSIGFASGDPWIAAALMIMAAIVIGYFDVVRVIEGESVLR